MPGAGEERKNEAVSVGKLSPSADKFELPGSELFVTIICKLFDQRIFTAHDFAEIKTGLVSLNSPNFGASHQVDYLSGVKKSFGRHAPPQNAKPGNFVASFYDYRLQPLVC